MNDLLQHAQDAVVRGTQWLVKHQCPDGSFVDCGAELVAAYKAPLALARSGSSAGGARCLQFIETRRVNRDGELSSGDGNVKTTFPRNQRNFANYMDGWVAIGAWLLGDYQFASRICDRLVVQQAVHGGILTGPEKWCGSPRYDVLTSASIGRAFLITGLRKEAAAAAKFLCDVVDPVHQRNSEKWLDMSFDAAWNHVEPADASDRAYYQLVYGRRGERVFCPAFACAFLCEAAQVADRARCLDAAKRYLAVITGTPEFLDRSLENGKSAWAAGMLGLATGDREAVNAALQIMPRVLARQGRDGEFGSAEGQVDPIAFAKRLESTAEHTAWANEYARLLSLGLG